MNLQRHKRLYNVKIHSFVRLNSSHTHTHRAAHGNPITCAFLLSRTVRTTCCVSHSFSSIWRWPFPSTSKRVEVLWMLLLHINAICVRVRRTCLYVALHILPVSKDFNSNRFNVRATGQCVPDVHVTTLFNSVEAQLFQKQLCRSHTHTEVSHSEYEKLLPNEENVGFEGLKVFDIAQKQNMHEHEIPCLLCGMYGVHYAALNFCFRFICPSTLTSSSSSEQTDDACNARTQFIIGRKGCENCVSNNISKATKTTRTWRTKSVEIVSEKE